jgi:hypothetical protein
MDQTDADFIVENLGFKDRERLLKALKTYHLGDDIDIDTLDLLDGAESD